MKDEATALLHAWRGGDEASRDQLVEMVYDTLRGIAAAQLRGRGGEDPLRPTVLVHEALLRMLGREVAFADRAHFCAVAALKMRAVLIDHARALAAAKRDGGEALTLTSVAGDGGAEAAVDVLALHQALERLAEEEPRAARAIEMSYFGGMERAEIAEVLQVSVPTVDRDLRFGRAWLNRALR
ncbi:ECF-type sigma factor [Coralloluteibacterium stylophorae]|uniref:Sigma-70 family RNA polymerase sigma factor n=1 Tax=Coralloluteibacterium stylophorae TaxID=1776034 RepID=A0AAP2FY84_9GAMM|nr:ECF-type sigma factor [Coralloluteibacterium stylophorae]MBS7456782.1 sigma-70 family RNA polymerase sigma factor [Coralloluteibacterium stylophorae]